MSTVKTNNVQVGQSGTATNNFTLYQPTVPDGTVRLGVGNTGATTADVITATSAGNVGIGTSSPGERLTVAATANNAARFTSTATTTALVLDNTNANAWGSNLAINTGGTAAGYFGTIGSLLGSTAQDLAVYATSGNGVRFYTNGNNERARIDSSGNLLVGTTSQIASGKVVLSYSGIDNNGIVFNDTATSSTTNATVFRRNGVQVGSINTTTTATTYSTSSDYRLKHDIQPMIGALAKVTALKPVTYKWNADNSNGEGFIAHELAEVVPDAVTGEKDAVDADGNIVPQGIDTSFLVATLTAAIQELTAKVEALEAKLAQTGA